QQPRAMKRLHRKVSFCMEFSSFPDSCLGTLRETPFREAFETEFREITFPNRSLGTRNERENASNERTRPLSVFRLWGGGANVQCRCSRRRGATAAAEVNGTGSRVEPRLRIQKKGTRGYNSIARLQAAQHGIVGNAVGTHHARAQVHLHAFEFSWRHF